MPSPCRNDLSHAESRMHSEQDQQSNHCHQRLDWTWSKTNWACSEFRAGFWTKTVALWPTLHQLLQTSFQSAVQCDMAAKSDRNGPYLKKGLPDAATGSLSDFSIFFNHRKIKTFETRHSFGHWVQPIPQKSPFISLLSERVRGGNPTPPHCIPRNNGHRHLLPAAEP